MLPMLAHQNPLVLILVILGIIALLILIVRRGL